MKAAGLLTTMEAKKLAGVASMTIAPALLHTLAETLEEAEALGDSMFAERAKVEADERNGSSEAKSFLNNGTAYRRAFASSYGGKGEAKTKQVSFCPFSYPAAKDISD